jgi:hypothetical protein
MADRGTELLEVAHKRRAVDRAEARAMRAADHGDTAAMRIAIAQRDELLRQRAEFTPKSR